VDLEDNYLEVNRTSWNNRTEVHISTDWYNIPAFIAGESSLKEIELGLLGDLSNQSALHLQCHFGMDTISLERLGAKATGVDLSNRAIEEAEKLAEKTDSKANFICSDIYDLPNHLEGQFDLVFTSYGTIGWLPDIDKWASVVNHFLKPGGRFIIAEFHPSVWMFDNDFSKVEYRYFNDAAIVENESSYADREGSEKKTFITWNHALSEVIQSLLKQGLKLDSFQEYDYSPFDCFSHTEEFEKSKFRIKHLENKIPMVYSLSCSKES
jgi:SAM-dependent methyltransferase